VSATERALFITRAKRSLGPGGSGARLRQSAGLSLRTVAEAVGVGYTTVRSWEEGLSVPSDAHAQAYGRFLELLDRELSR
jgi:DNA-binding transcriptional regulator YiaG